jgi:GWxTD domain-containing protein
LAAFACLACASGGGVGGSGASMGELTNPFLSPDYSAWLVGPVARIASEAEIKSYLALQNDAGAAAFIQQFWERRKTVKLPPPAPGALPIPTGGNPVLALFEERAAVADKKFTEAGVLGRRTDRGTVLVLYGPPAKGGFEVPPGPLDPPIEVWGYAADAPAGLDGKRPDRFYRFAKRGDLTVIYIPRPGHRLVPHGAPP